MTYRIEVDNMYSQIMLRKVYYTYPQALMARRMKDYTKYGDCVIRIYQFDGEKRGKLVNVVNDSNSNS